MNYRATCLVTGKTENLHMHPHRNGKNEMVGWIFLHESIHPADVTINTEWDTRIKPAPFIGERNLQLDHNPHA